MDCHAFLWKIVEYFLNASSAVWNSECPFLDYMPPKAKEPCLPCYLTYSWWVGEKRWIHAFPEDICMNVWKWMQQTTYFCFCINILTKVPNTQRLAKSFSFILFSFLIRTQHICLYCIFIYKVNMFRHFPLVAYQGIAYNTTAFSLLFLIFCILLQDKILCTLCFLLWTIIGFCDWQKPELKTTLWPYSLWDSGRSYLALMDVNIKASADWQNASHPHFYGTKWFIKDSQL